MRMLLATDGSLEADLAEVALTRLPASKREIVVAMVATVPTYVSSPFAPVAEIDVSESSMLQQVIAERTVSQICERLEEGGCETQPLVVQGDVVGQLLNLAGSLHPDVIAVGSHFDSNVQAFFLGSVCRKLTLYSEASLLVARHYRKRQVQGSVERLRSKPKLSVLVAVDGSPGSDVAVESLASVAEGTFERLSVLTVVPDGGRPRKKGRHTETPSPQEVAASDIARQAAERLAHCADTVEPLALSGRPSSVIVRVAAEIEVDLIVMAATRHSALERLMVGSCAYETVANAPCSVLILRRPMNLG